MRRLAILDHDNHALYIEDINEEILEGQYGGDEELYIEDNHNLKEYAWNWIVETQYFSEFNQLEPIEINFEEIGRGY